MAAFVDSSKSNRKVEIFFLSKPDENVFSSQHGIMAKAIENRKPYTPRAQAHYEKIKFSFLSASVTIVRHHSLQFALLEAKKLQQSFSIFRSNGKASIECAQCAYPVACICTMCIPNRKKTGRAYEYSVKQVSHTANQINGLCAASIQLKVQLTFTCRFYAQKP